MKKPTDTNDLPVVLIPEMNYSARFKTMAKFLHVWFRKIAVSTTPSCNLSLMSLTLARNPQTSQPIPVKEKKASNILSGKWVISEYLRSAKYNRNTTVPCGFRFRTFTQSYRVRSYDGPAWTKRPCKFFNPKNLQILGIWSLYLTYSYIILHKLTRPNLTKPLQNPVLEVAKLAGTFCQGAYCERTRNRSVTEG